MVSNIPSTRYRAPELPSCSSKTPTGSRSKSTSDERAHRIRSVPPDAGAIELAENRLESRTQLDQFHIARQLRRGVHVGHAAPARHAGEKHEIMTLRLIMRHVPIEVARRAAPVMKSVAALIDPFAIHRRLRIVGLNELYIHVPCEAHGKRHVGLGVTAPVLRMGAAEVIEQEPWTHLQLIDPQLHGGANVGHQVAHLNDPIVRLTKSHETHGSPLTGCSSAATGDFSIR